MNNESDDYDFEHKDLIGTGSNGSRVYKIQKKTDQQVKLNLSYILLIYILSINFFFMSL